ncbi:MAG TPA: hypothetical protein VHX63_01835 [Acidobacteriaceae bacterium]|jgi:hypothetical protein|nr:hypothetical protein [Acidobacteriaceae bacterium]
MVGAPQDNSEHLSIVEKWFAETLEGGGLERFDELHISRVDQTWAAKDRWVVAGLEVFQLAATIKSRRRSLVTVVVSFSLLGAEAPLGIDFSSIAEMEAQLTLPPPSLYLFRPGEEPWFGHGAMVAPVDVSRLFMELEATASCFYLEFKPAGEEAFSRTVFIAG